MENMNPGGTGKDRAVQHMIKCAEENGLLKKGGNVIEGTSGRLLILFIYDYEWLYV